MRNRIAVAALALGALLAAGEARADTVTLDFDVGGSGHGTVADPYTEDGFSLRPSNSNFHTNVASPNPALTSYTSAALMWGENYANNEYYTVIVEKIDGGWFGLTSLVLATFDELANQPNGARLTGYTALGGTVSAQIGSRGTATFSFGSEWSSIIRLDIMNRQADNIFVDNLALTTVPLPRSAFMTLALLGGLGVAKVLRSRGRKALA